jgi:hypothetical protein
VNPEVADDCLADCGDDCAGCDCDCHQEETAGADALAQAASAQAASAQATPDDRDPDVYPRSEQELTALDRLSELVAEQSGRLERRVGQIQDSAEIRRFVVAALRAAEQARTADDSRSGEKE